jgi:hypothetical protein
MICTKDSLLINKQIVRFEILKEASIKFRDFWDVVPCSHV